MREVFEDKDHDRAQPHLEPDLTLGPVTLLGLLFIWALICALFFGWGYAVGHRGSEDTSAVMKPAPASSQAGYAQSKPSAVSQTEIATAAESDGADQVGNPSSTEASDADASSISQSAAPAGAAGSSSRDRKSVV